MSPRTGRSTVNSEKILDESLDSHDIAGKDEVGEGKDKNY